MTDRVDGHDSVIPVLCRACKGRQCGLCAALEPDQLVALSKTSIKRRAQPGSALTGDAKRVENYSNLLSGVVKLTKTLADGRQQIVGLQFAPDFLGRPFRRESAINAEAATDVALCTFPRTAVERMMKDSPKLEHRLLQQTLRELDEAREWMVTLGRKSASEKVASFLLRIARHIDPTLDASADKVTFDLPLSRADIADSLGLTVETVSRQITKLRSEGVIRVENSRHVIVENMARLERRAAL